MEERLDIASDDVGTVAQHLARYKFAQGFAKGKRVVDAACGTGYGSQYFSEGWANSYLGIDISAGAIEACKSQFSKLGVEFQQGSVLELSKFGKFDLAVSFETIEHIREYKEFLFEVKKSLTDDATFIVSSPVRWSGALEDKPANPFHTQEWSESEFLELLKPHYSSIELHYQYGLSHAGSAFSEVWTRRFWKILFSGQSAKVASYPVGKHKSAVGTFLPLRAIFVIAVCRGAKN
jgi:cyclopropane fatty-acyl-phospholipid synthase-like methyltransferase